MKIFSRYIIALLLVVNMQSFVCAEDTIRSTYFNGALVQSIIPVDNRQDVAMIFIPGMNLSTYIYATTPDGRDGWAQLFANSGFDVYLVNDSKFDFARGGFAPPFDDVPTEGQPPVDSLSTLPWQRDIWPRWGFGPVEGTPYEDARFPTDYFDVFASNYPYVSKPVLSYEEIILMLIDSIEKPVYLVAHSAGGPIGLNVSKQRTSEVRGVIYIEPTGPPTEMDFPALNGKVMLGVYGDYIDSRNQTSRKIATEAAAQLFNDNGGVGKVISLPEDYQIYGNSHLMMQGNNNDFIQQLIFEWMVEVDPAISDNSCAAEEWGKTISYIKGSVVSHNGHEWWARRPSLGKEPPHVRYWDDLGQCGQETVKLKSAENSTDEYNSINETNNFTFTISPNPSRFEAVRVRIDNFNIGVNYKLKVYNISGDLIYSQQINSQVSYIRNIKLLEGIYFVEIDSGNLLVKKKLIVQE